ncbi:hypothetical protein MIND_00693600 [Mycena indigotica]|uniref:Uncharacterized protein n=1 Tax=Mycena indigotica TaxID=2126181 RepID=A0A8H6SN42_9AGAR|nr:uncharacterized protein MIND_00693600 [Mycena indigotica]KAF7301287.1 hypothetical protein MIND_00693600 [Mycena indigotica]
MLRARTRYTALPTSAPEDDDDADAQYRAAVAEYVRFSQSRLHNLDAGRPSAGPTFFADEDEEGMLTRARPPDHPPDPRFHQPAPPAWQRAGLILAIVGSIWFTVWLQSGHWHMGVVV